MKLTYQHNPFGPAVTCIDSSEYDGAPDAGAQLVGEGDTEEAARDDFMDQWMERESARDVKRAVDHVKVWDGVLEQIFQREMK